MLWCSVVECVVYIDWTTGKKWESTVGVRERRSVQSVFLCATNWKTFTGIEIAGSRLHTKFQSCEEEAVVESDQPPVTAALVVIIIGNVGLGFSIPAIHK